MLFDHLTCWKSSQNLQIIRKETLNNVFLNTDTKRYIIIKVTKFLMLKLKISNWLVPSFIINVVDCKYHCCSLVLRQRLFKANSTNKSNVIDNQKQSSSWKRLSNSPFFLRKWGVISGIFGCNFLQLNVYIDTSSTTNNKNPWKSLLIIHTQRNEFLLQRYSVRYRHQKWDANTTSWASCIWTTSQICRLAKPSYWWNTES